VNSDIIRQVGEELLGKTSGKGVLQDKETWWWNNDVQENVMAKKKAKKRADTYGNEEDKQVAKRANKEAKKAVVRAKASAVNETYDGLETWEGVKKTYSLAKRRNKATKDLTQIKQIRSETGEVLSNEQEIKARWKIYFERLLNEENGRRVFGEGTANERETLGIARDEVRVALKRMKSSKATGSNIQRKG